MKKLLLTAAAAFILLAADAQLKTPAPSPTQTVKQDFGLSNIELSYSRPGMKGRKIYGDLVPFGKVWRTGANEATVVTFTDNVIVQGEPLAVEQMQHLVDTMTWEGFEQMRVAYVATPGRHMSRVEVAEILARERGLNVRVFSNETDATLWLRYGAH